MHRRALFGCLLAGMGTLGAGLASGLRHPWALAVVGLAGLCLATLSAAVILEVRRRRAAGLLVGLGRTLLEQRRQWAGYTVHVGLMVLAIGITGSALGHRRHEALLKEGTTEAWAGRQIRFRELVQRREGDVLVVEAVLDVTDASGRTATLRPARHLHLLQNEWTTEVDIHATWAADLYTVLEAGLPDGSVAVTFVENPMMRWLWSGGILATVGGLAALAPAGRRRTRGSLAPPAPETTEAAPSPERLAA